MSKRTIKLSSLSEGLRKEVKKHLKEGRTKLGQMPTRLRKLIESEAFYGTDSDEYRPDMESSSRAIPKFTLKPRKNAGEFEGESGPWKVWIYTYNDGKKFGWTLLHRGESLVGGEGHSSLKAACKAAEKEATLDRYQHLKEGRTKMSQMPPKLKRLIENETVGKKEFIKNLGNAGVYGKPDMYYDHSKNMAIAVNVYDRTGQKTEDTSPRYPYPLPQVAGVTHQIDKENREKFMDKRCEWCVYSSAHSELIHEIGVLQNNGPSATNAMNARASDDEGGYFEEQKTINLSSLSEGLRKEVKKHLKEGRTKMSMLPSKLANKILIEMEHDSSGNPIAPWDRKGPKSPHGSDLPYVPHSRINAGTYDIDGEFSSSDDIGDDDNFNVNVDDTELLSAMEDAKMQSENGYVVHVNKSPKGDYELSDWYDDESTVASYENGRKLNENKRASMKNKQIKLSSLSEGLRKEVKKHLKEGRTKLGQMPPKLANEILSEMNDMGSQFDSSGNPILPWGSNGSSK